MAPIVPITINAVNISGDAFAGGIGSTDPNATFTHEARPPPGRGGLRVDDRVVH